MSVDLTDLDVARGLLVTPEEAAAMVGVPRGTFEVWASRAKLDRVRIGRHAWFWSDDVFDVQREYRMRAAGDATRDRNGKFVRRLGLA